MQLVTLGTDKAGLREKDSNPTQPTQIVNNFAIITGPTLYSVSGAGTKDQIRISPTSGIAKAQNLFLYLEASNDAWNLAPDAAQAVLTAVQVPRTATMSDGVTAETGYPIGYNPNALEPTPAYVELKSTVSTKFVPILFHKS